MPTTQSEHIVSAYQDELVSMGRMISEMGGQVEAALSNATEALIRLDHDLARETAAGDRAIDEMQRQIDELAVSVIARRQPMASDLRLIIASIHVANDLERIGDMAKSIARRALQMEGDRLSAKLYTGLRHMTELTLQQIQKALDAFAGHNPDAAIEICANDDEIDALYVSLFRELLTYMMEDPRNITQCTHLLFCGKNLERVGDHATNIAEAAYYLETGKILAVEMEDIRAQPKP